MSQPFAVGVSRPRPDSEEKVRGTIRYEADRRHPGEVGVVGGPAAIANAVRAATGFRPTVLPITAARLWRSLQVASSGPEPQAADGA